MSNDDLQELKSEVATIRNNLHESRLEVVRLQGRIEAMRNAIHLMADDIKKLDKSKVAIIVFNPVQKLIYGLVGSILIAFLAAVISLVIPGKASIGNVADLSPQKHEHVVIKDGGRPGTPNPEQ